jgi:hypothetical protein
VAWGLKGRADKLIHAPTINVTMNAGDRDAANQSRRAYSMEPVPLSALAHVEPGQIAADASVHIQRMGLKNG